MSQPLSTTQEVDCILLVKEKTRHTPQNGNNQIFNLTLIKPRFKTNRMNVEPIFVKISKKTNFAVSSHHFRHTFATKLANNGQTSIKTVQSLLGHSSVHTTLGYVHLSMDDMRCYYFDCSHQEVVLILV